MPKVASVFLLHYKIYVDGTVDLEQTYLPQGELPELPRLGSAFVLGEEYENLSWYGRGPWENYPDRKTSCLIGRWNSKVSEQYTHYPASAGQWQSRGCYRGDSNQ